MFSLNFLRARFVAGVVGAILLACMLGAAQASPRILTADLVLYDDTLAASWGNTGYSYSVNVDYNGTAQVHGGVKAIAVSYTADYGGLSLRADAPVSMASYTALDFWIYGDAGGTPISLYTQPTDAGASAGSYAFNAPAGVWTQFTVLLSSLGSPANIQRLNFQLNRTGTANIWLDDIRLVGAGGSPSFPDSTADHIIPGGGAFSQPSGVALAPNGRVFVVDYGNNRVLSWAGVSQFLGGQASDVILGGGPGAGDNQMNGPESMAVDAQNRVYIADTSNQRVLVFVGALATGMNVTYKFGVMGVSAALENKFQFPRGMAFDPQGDLLLVDEFNNRVLIYQQPFQIPATPDFTPDAQITNLNAPRGVAVDTNGNVYVTDSENDVVREYNAPGVTNRNTADRTLGTVNAANIADCTNPTAPAQTTQNTMACPIDVAVDAQNNVYVSDIYNQRILAFQNPITSDTTPDALYGQATYTDRLPNRGGAAAANTLSTPLGMAFDSNGNFYVADFDNNRMLVFDAPLALTVNVAVSRTAISPYIYGLNFAKEAFASEIGLPVRRWGGNSLTRYNWQINATNQASDWFFHNNTFYDAYTGMTQTTDQWVAQNQRTGSESLISAPMAGYVAKDGNQTTCGFSVAKYGPQDQTDVASGFPDCGNGLSGGVPIVNNPLDTSVVITQAFVSAWVNHLKTTHGAAFSGGVRFYALDNEPGLWHETHRDVHPEPFTYDESYNQGALYAAAIKAADSGALILGPVQDGWTRYWWASYASQAQAEQDRQNHGGTAFVPWYLQQMSAYQQVNGVRLLDYLDLHFYPQNGVDMSVAGDATKQALRLRSTRALWDPTYVDESWIAAAGPDGGIVRLIPRMRQWVSENYPGTKTAITEYNWGGLEDINGALTQADILGIFGREGLDFAALWNYPDSNLGTHNFETQPGAYAFRMYRNYDGQGGKFGDVSISASSSDQSQLSIYAAQRNSDSALTLMIINKTGGGLTGGVSLAGFTPASSAQVYRYSATNLNAIVPQADQPVTAGGFVASFPANSITLMVLPPGAALNNKVYLPLIQR